MSLLKKISILILNFILLFILSCNNTKSDIKDKKKKSKTEKKIDVKSLSSRFSKADESDKEDILDELSDASNPDGVMIIIQGLLDKDKEVREKAINVLESYRRFTLKDLDINYYEYIDNWFRQYQLIILQHMGYEK
ncbi:MAG: hypothetical protein OEV44_14460, partial [Spirochaetota bacterium]|nr:hypothetical protein [Spirochaetota bacterium]